MCNFYFELSSCHDINLFTLGSMFSSLQGMPIIYVEKDKMLNHRPHMDIIIFMFFCRVFGDWA